MKIFKICICLIVAAFFTSCGGSIKTFSGSVNSIAVDSGLEFRVQFNVGNIQVVDCELIDDGDSEVISYLSSIKENPTDPEIDTSYRYFLFEAIDSGTTEIAVECEYDENTELPNSVKTISITVN